MIQRYTSLLSAPPFGLILALVLLTAPAQAQIIVNTVADDETAGNDQCTLREAINSANAGSDQAAGDCAATGGDYTAIHFNIASDCDPDTDVCTISPTSVLPALTAGGLTIDGYTQPGARANTLSEGTDAVLLIELEGSSAGEADGLTLNSSNNTIRGLIINNFFYYDDEDFIAAALHINGSTGNVIEGNYIGTDHTGESTAPNLVGIYIENAADNRIGTDGDGSADPAERNVITGNAYLAVHIQGNGATGNVVAGNYIGLHASGITSCGNGGPGIFIDEAPGNRIGTDGNGLHDAAERNIFTGNGGAGIFILGAGATNNVVAGNYIGVGADGLTPLGNEGDGIFLLDASQNIIGTDGSGTHDPNERNVISANSSNGISIMSSAPPGSEATFAAATTSEANQRPSVRPGRTKPARPGRASIVTDLLRRSRQTSQKAPHARMAVAAITAVSGNVIAGNYIGVGADGLTPLGNGWDGVSLMGTSQTLIGTNGDGLADEAERNVISANGYDGIYLVEASENVIAGNYIGTDYTGSTTSHSGEDLGNTLNGISIATGSSNLIGTNGDGLADEAERNIISGNGGVGIEIDGVSCGCGGGGSQATDNVIAGNYIGTDITGLLALPNIEGGILLYEASTNRIGTDGNGTADADERNVIAGNWDSGIYVLGSEATGNVIAGNYIGVGADGTTAMGNWGDGIELYETSANYIGTNAAGSVIGGNVISNNEGDGISIEGGGGNIIAGNYIGVGADGTTPMGNWGDGIDLDDSSNNLIGLNPNGPNPAQGNIIAYNAESGIDGGGTSNAFIGNAIFANSVLGIELDALDNDPGDGDTGANNLQNSPVFVSSVFDEGTGEGTVTYVVDSDLVHSAYPLRIDFYVADASGQGAVHLGFQTYTEADYNGCGSPPCEKTFAFTNGSLTEADFLVATATDAANNTSEFTDTSQPLPVELTSFHALSQGADVLLRWATASETNNAGFAVEHATVSNVGVTGRSPLQPEWQSLAFIPGHGTTTEARAYAFTATNLAPGTHRFRLKQMDYDGAFTYSPEVEATVAVPDALLLTAPYPNPFMDQTAFTVGVQTGQPVRVEAFDALGRRVAVLYEGHLPGGDVQPLRFEAGHLPSGLYFIRAAGQTEVRQLQVVLAR